MEEQILRLSDGSWRLENQQLEVNIYPWLGGKIGALRHRPTGFQPVFQGRPLRPAGLYEPFDEYDASGLDDAFPSVVEEQVEWNGDTLHFPDHGEIWSASLSSCACGDTLELAMDSKILPYRYEKRIRLEENSLVLDYTISHTGGQPFSCHWTFHGLFQYHPEMRLLIPGEGQQVVNVTESRRFGALGSRYSFPEGQLPDGSRWDFCQVPPSSSEKFWLTEPVKRGLCGYLYPHAGMKVLLEYDPEQLPYLGCWITAGGFRGEYNCALEPSNGYYDSVTCAQAHDRCPVLEPGKPWHFSIRIRLEEVRADKRTLD